MMTRLQELYTKYLDGSISEQQKKELFAKIKSSEDGQLRHLAEGFLNSDVPGDLSHLQPEADQLFLQIKGRLDNQQVSKHKVMWRWLPYAAAIILVAATATFLFNRQHDDNAAKNQLIAVQDVSAGANRATLRLATGKTINLDDVGLGQVALDQGMRITKTADGQLSYEVVENTSLPNGMNTISTPNGGQYTVKLPDGSLVYLNAASQLKYPIRFDGAQRRVELSGEGYFEITKDSKRPFLVSTQLQEVRVLGTHFNVNSYQDNGQTVTTLVEGSVKVTSDAGTKLIIPGEQTLVDGRSIKSQEADLEIALAWKNGRIEFKDAELRNIMDDVARWYDIDVKYQGVLPQRRFTASIPRNSNLSSLLKVLELSNINFEIHKSGNRKQLIVKP